MDPSSLLSQTTISIIVSFFWKLIGALALWVVGSWLINFAMKLIRSAMRRQNLDSTLTSYLTNILGVTLKIVLIIAILGFFGIQTASFAALLAGAGVAIGAAWSGMLANLAAGVFLIIFRPFTKGDFVTGGGVTGTVEEIGLFVTTIHTLDNLTVIVANNKLFSDNIINYSALPYRRVDLTAQISHSTDHNQAIQLLKAGLSKIPNVLSDPAPDVEILEFNPRGPVLVVRPYCNNEHYWQVYFDTNRLIRETFSEAGFSIPDEHFTIRREAA
jgi:small conductance mechanosensitive channel